MRVDHRRRPADQLTEPLVLRRQLGRHLVAADTAEYRPPEEPAQRVEPAVGPDEARKMSAVTDRGSRRKAASQSPMAFS